MTQTIMTKSLNLILGVTLSLSIVSCGSGSEDGIQDCNLNGVDDALDIDAGVGDCNSDGVLDECELADGAVEDHAEEGDAHRPGELKAGRLHARRAAGELPQRVPA